MTAQEAAKESLSWLKHYRWAVGFVGVGVTVAAAGLYSEEIKAIGGLFGGIIMQALGVASWLMEKTAKRASTEVVKGASEQVSQQVVEKLKADLDDMRDAHLQSADAMVNLTKLYSEGESDRRRMHDENLDQLKSVKQDIEMMKSDHAEIRDAIEHVGQAVEAVNKDFKMRPFKKDGK